MRLLYVTDTKLFYNEHGIYKKDYLEPDELGALNENITEVVFWGRLYYTKDTEGLCVLESDKYTLTVLGNKNQRSGLFGHILGFFKTLKALRREIASSDFVWLKFSFFSSFVAGLCLPKKDKSKKIVLSQLVGDFDCGSIIHPGAVFRLITPISKAFYRKVIKKCDLQVYVSHTLEDKYKVSGIKSLVENENRVKFCDIIAPEDIPPRTDNEPLRLIFVGRLSPEKRIFDIIDAAWHTDNVTLSILGDGSQKSQISEYISSHALENEVVLCGTRQWGEDLFSFIKTHHALVLPSESEGLPLVLLEAMSLGISVIASFSGGIPEIVKDGKNGQLFSVGNTEELKVCIEKIRDSEALRRSFIECGLITARENCFESQLKLLSSEVEKILIKKAHTI